MFVRGAALAVTIRFGLSVHWDWMKVAVAVAAYAALLGGIDILWVIVTGIAISALAL
jgi:hypothetical protein